MGGKSNPALGAEQQALQNQTNLSNTLLGGYNNAVAQNNQFYQTPLSGVAGTQNASVNALHNGLPGAYSTALNTQGNLSGQTGINQNQLGQNLTNYASNTGGTNLSQQNPALSGFYQGEMKNGLNPQVAQNAQNQVAQSAAQQESNAKASHQPGQNLNAVTRDIQNNQLAQSANLAGNLAGESQQFMNQGAQGLGANAQTQDQQILNMLMQGAQFGQGANTQALQNLLSAGQFGQSGLNNAQSFINQGNANVGGYTNALSGLVSNAANQAAQFGQQAQQQQQSSSLGGILGSVGGMFSPIKL
jgi:hypothetical protein